MKIRRCCLCDGRVVNGICVECGMHNKKQDSDYRLNTGTCDNKPLTHVHKESSTSSWESLDAKWIKQEETKERIRQELRERRASKGKQISGSSRKSSVEDYNRQYKKETAQTPKRKKSVLWIIVAAIAVVNIVVPFIMNLADELSINDALSNYLAEEELHIEDVYDPYEYIEKELAETGIPYETVLTAGHYIVGADIPEGRYTAVALNNQGSFYIEDYDTGIFYSEYMGDGTFDDDVIEVEDIRLFNGAEFTVSGAIEMQLTTENALTAELFELPGNPLTEEITLHEGRFIAGIDFPEGTYDIVAYEGYGSVDLMYEEDGEEYYMECYYVDADPEQPYDPAQVLHVVIPEGFFLEIEEFSDFSVSLVPSGRIIGEDYAAYYDYY